MRSPWTPTQRGLVGSALHAAGSIARTAAGIDRATDAQVAARLAVCETCQHATRRKDGSLHGCGPMLKSMQDKNLKTCGCVLKRKARDIKEDCPHQYWPRIESSTR